MKIGLLLDNCAICRWQSDALRQLGEDVTFVAYNCTNARSAPRRWRHLPYYALNLASLRTALTRKTSLADSVKLAGQVDFECKAEGVWQSLPDSLIDRINADKPDAIVKFGMGLLRIPERLAAPVLSYHHGDPRRFRGRPAGFYELLNGERVLGQIVQILSNRLDAGPVVAFAETRVHRHSYRATMREAYGTSPLLLPKALTLAITGQVLDIAGEGRVYRLPSPWTVLRFASQRLAAKLLRLAYGLFIEKAWRVASTPLQFHEPPFFDTFPQPASWLTVECPREFRFLADPFPNPAGEGMLVEAMRSSTGLGEIIHLATGQQRTLLAGGGHYSYPATLTTRAGHFLLPEICQWSSPAVFRLENGRATPIGTLDMSRPTRLVDPTLFARNGTIYLFGNDYSEGDGVLRLWLADQLDGCFCEHPVSPLRISPCGARMAGALVEQGDLYRVGQDRSRDYGDGVLLFRVEEITPSTYRETLVDELRFSTVRGPHTVNFAAGAVLFDFYEHRLAPLAWLRRLRNRLASRYRLNTEAAAGPVVGGSPLL